MKTVIITGSTRGIGYGLADAFLNLGCQVVVSGRSEESVNKAITDLSARQEARRIAGFACDVTKFDQVQALWDFGVQHFGRVDIWINNAGIANPLTDFWNLTPELVSAVIGTNIQGASYGSIVALRAMLKQGSGALYNLEGYGSNGKSMVNGLAPYGLSKAAIHFLDGALAREIDGQPVIVGSIQPGMVATDMITSQYEGKPQDWERARRIFNIIADRVETVTPWIAAQVLANTKNGARIRWAKPGRTFLRFLTAPFSKRNIFDE